MSTTARLEQLKRDLAQVEKRGSRTRRLGSESDRGREADYPGEIPPKGWMDVLWRAWSEVSDQNLFLIAGGVTYALLLRCFPPWRPWSRCTGWCSTRRRSRSKWAPFRA